MYILLELTYTDKESQALYTSYTSETEILGEVETKLGQAMKSDAIHAEYLIAIDHTGRSIAQKYYNDDPEFSFSPRLIWVTSDAEGEHPNMQKYESVQEAEANYHLKRGGAIKDVNVLAILTMIVGGMIEYWVRPIEVVPEEQAE